MLAANELVGDWVVVRRLSSGGFGLVYEVAHRTTRHPAAVKLLHAHLVESPEMLARFDREIAIVSRLRHPSIVQLIDAGFHHGQPFLAMELLDGEDLHRRLVRGGAMTPPEAIAVLAPLCDALAAAHEQGIFHRDVKASNVMIGSSGRVVLLDFGIAKLSDALAPELTASNQVLGTPSAMAPEQILSAPPTARTDVYALGILLFQMVAGRLPFDDTSATMTRFFHLHARRPRASAVAEVGRALDEVIERAMAIDPADRYADARTMCAAAQAALSSRSRPSPAPDKGAAILVEVRDRDAGAALDDALVVDLEAVLPAAERYLAGTGFTAVADFGSSALFVAARDADPVGRALGLWDHLQQRRRADPRVVIGICAHEGTAEVLRCPVSWNAPDLLEGVWVTGAIDPSAPRGKRLV
jgi:serine/threonine-protein kinase